ncbi:MAG: KH domain-containing protein [Patescibacteria group bacterium]|nr:KH domain-containing protein [Patescibacteria group bacterium]
MVEKDQEFLEFVIKGLVDHPNEVKINRTVDEMGVLLTLDLNAEDMGKVIGRSGNTAKAIRTLLRVVGMKNNARVNLKINEPAGGMRSGAPSMAEYRAENPAPSQSPAMKSVDEAMEELGSF